MVTLEQEHKSTANTVAHTPKLPLRRRQPMWAQVMPRFNFLLMARDRQWRMPEYPDPATRVGGLQRFLALGFCSCLQSEKARGGSRLACSPCPPQCQSNTQT